MNRTIYCVALLAIAAPVLAQDQPAGSPGTPDMTRMGPLSRPVAKEDKKGIDAVFKTTEEAWKRGDLNALADNVDFPVLMLSDDSRGAVKSFYATREQWLAIMKPFVSNMPKDMKMSHKHTPHFLSDTLAVTIEENDLSAGKTKGKWKSMSVLTLKDGKWKFKEMAEAGWGDMKLPSGMPGGSPSTPAPPGAPSAK